MVGLGRELERRPGQSVVVAVQDARVLDAAVGIEEPRADGADAVELRVAHHRRQPARIADLGVVVQEQQVVGVDAACGDVVHVREREARPRIADTQHAVREPREVVDGSPDRRSRCRRRRPRSCGTSSARANRGSARARRGGSGRDQHGDARAVVGELVTEEPETRARRPLRLHRAAAAAAPRERFVDRPLRDLEARRLRGAVRRRRPGRRAPVIEHERQVDDAPRALDRAEREIVVLRALEARAKAVERGEERSPHDERVREVHVRQQELGRPVGLELRRVAAAVNVDLVVVGVEDVGVGRGGQGQRDLAERVGRKLVVLIEEEQEVARRELGRGVRRAADVAVLGAVDDPDPRIAAASASRVPGERGVAARVVGDAELPARVNLRVDGLDRAVEPLSVGPVDRHHDRDRRQRCRRRRAAP